MVDLIVTSVNPSDALTPSSGAQAKDVLKELPTVGLPGDYFYSPMQLRRVTSLPRNNLLG